MTRSPRRLRADWVLPVAAPPIADGAVLVGEEGRVLAVGPDGSVPHPDGVSEERLPATVLCPGLVNTHTHLELTGFGEAVTGPGFVDWITNLRRLKATRSPDEFLAAALQGVRDCWAAGVTTVADTGDTGAVMRALHHLGGTGICYQEVFGPDPAQERQSLAWLQERLSELTPYEGPRLRLGVSPHAPYSVSAGLYAAVAALARDQDRPLAVHLAESHAESDLVCRGTGEFTALWSERGISPPPPARSPVAYLDAAGVLGANTLAIHLVQVDDEDIARLAARRTAVAHCPLSNRRHAHGTAPLRAMRAAGLCVGLGTDSVASVGRLDLLAEARAARVLAALDAEEAVALCTVDAAAAIGLVGEVGVLAEGAWGDIVAIRLRDAAPADLYEAVLGSGPRDVRATWIGGREVFRAAAGPLSLHGDPLPAGA